MHKKQTGFTLIELVMVIVILGILAAFALPKFADLTGDARSASINGLAGALKSAAAIARAEQLANSETLGFTVTLDGEDVTMVNGYPTANAAGIGDAASVAATDYTAAGGGTAGGVTITYAITGYSGSNCQATYTSADAATDNTGPITDAPVVAVVTTGC